MFENGVAPELVSDVFHVVGLRTGDGLRFGCGLCFGDDLRPGDLRVPLRPGDLRVVEFPPGMSVFRLAW